MLIDGRYLPRDVRLTCDVTVVGAGPAGITLAQGLAAAGLDVVLLEAGSRHHGRADDDFLASRSVGAPLPTVTSRRRGFAGTSGHWTPETGLRIRELDAVDLQPLDVRPDGWPFDLAALAPFYRRAREQVGVDAEVTSVVAGDATGTPLAWSGGPQLAVYQFAAHDTFVERFDEIAASNRIELILHSTVADIVLDHTARQVSHVTVRCPGGNGFSVGARSVVLACGAIENARVLLSSPGPSGAGIGNEHDLVGRYLMEHLSIDCGILEPLAAGAIDTAPFEEVPAASGLPKSQSMLWLGEHTIRQEQLLNAAFWVFDASASYFSEGVSAVRSLRAAFRTRPVRGVGMQLGRALRHAGDIGTFALGRARETDVVAVRMLAEQAPERDSRVTLDTATDQLGRRRLLIDWRVTDGDLDSMRRQRELLGQALERRGIARLTGEFDPGSGASPLMSNFHHLGTTRMHDDPRHGVVDASSQVHSVANLFVTGGSVFPTGGYLNPTLTIIALAIRLADELKRRLGV